MVIKLLPRLEGSINSRILKANIAELEKRRTWVTVIQKNYRLCFYLFCA